MAASPPTSTTVRRNPSRRPRRPAQTPAALPPAQRSGGGRIHLRRRHFLPPPTPPAADAGVSPVLAPPPPTPTPVAAAAIPTALSSTSSQSADERLKVYLRIRPLQAPAQERDRGGRPKAKEAPPRQQQAGRRPPPRQAGAGSDGVCLVATGPGSVALTVPQSKLVDGKRGRVATEVFDGFSAVLPPHSSQVLGRHIRSLALQEIRASCHRRYRRYSVRRMKPTVALNQQVDKVFERLSGRKEKNDSDLERETRR